MFTDNWPSCIVTAFDLVGTRGLAASGKGSSAMIDMHNRAAAKINHDLPLHSHGYIWNDSVLLLSYMTEPNWSKQGFFAELNAFKSFLEQQCGTSMYAISVKGLAFPQDIMTQAVFNGQIADQPRAVVLKTSSWAMANCFLIEKALGHHRADWYIDSRITAGANLPKSFASEIIDLLPKNDPRTIDMFKGSIGIDG
ncbi:hypothetical protein JFT85_23005 [Pseudomonas sp. TH04]|uniref:hypothetical protein n=1 Tax=Pseudomonas sp. TH04 TaxID=2796370 RepID=UPI0019130C66|nr:hypothetical protein [Pseudomonas sp. TH04]MBK5547633.1 hypothetical protein [Pseudomonas sp. TH04]